MALRNLRPLLAESDRNGISCRVNRTLSPDCDGPRLRRWVDGDFIRFYKSALAFRLNTSSSGNGLY
jgi:hypothetical protein